VTLREDESLLYAEGGTKIMALFSRMLLNLIKTHPLEGSVTGKMMRASWDSKFRGGKYYFVKNQAEHNPALLLWARVHINCNFGRSFLQFPFF
jgi:hypothetical protein